MTVDPAETERILRDEAVDFAHVMARWSVRRWPLMPPLDLLDDRTSDALEGAWEAVVAWQGTDRTPSLRAFLSRSCRHRIVDGIRYRLGRPETARALTEARTASLDEATDAWGDLRNKPTNGALIPQQSVGIDEPGYRAVEDADEAAWLLTCLPDHQADAVRGVWLQGRTGQDVADQLGISGGAVTHRLQAAERRLRIILTDAA
jgi:RNA polymerase sigma factor (sigma-70 family)